VFGLYSQNIWINHFTQHTEILNANGCANGITGMPILFDMFGYAKSWVSTHHVRLAVKKIENYGKLTEINA
jgi:hypothetical protein